MADLDTARADPEAALWDALDDVTAGMLVIRGSGQLPQPMAHHCDREARRIWFFTDRRTDLFEALGSGSAGAEFTIVSKDRDFHAAVEGDLREIVDRHRARDMWNPMIGAWFEGPDDPNLAMLAFDPKRASIWASTDSSIAFLWETAKANVTDGRPDVGLRRDVAFRPAGAGA